jgi:Spy/CpxP family protein refolding chaperone
MIGVKRAWIPVAVVAVLAASATVVSRPYGGYGPGFGMGPGMMGGYGGGWGYGLDLSPEQRAKIADIQQEAAQQRWQLMERMHAAGGPMYQAFSGGEFDEQAARKAYDAMAEARKQMFEASLEARKRINAVLTPEQREQLRRGYTARWSKPKP